MTYAEKLKDPRWQKKRLEILSRDEFSCQHCYDDTSTLHVHHTMYHGEPWDAPDEQLITLCQDCHTKEKEAFEEEIKLLIKTLKENGWTSYNLANVTEFIGSLKNPYYKLYPPFFQELTRIVLDHEVWDNANKIATQRFIENMNQKKLENG